MRWLRRRVPDFYGNDIPNPISLISQWKILDNLRRSLLEPSLLILLLGSWFYLPGPARILGRRYRRNFLHPGMVRRLLRGFASTPRPARAGGLGAGYPREFRQGQRHGRDEPDLPAAPGVALDGCHRALGGPHPVHAAQASRVGDRRRGRSVRRPESHGGCVPGMDSLARAGPRRGALADSPRRAAGSGSRAGAVDGLARLFGLAQPPPAHRPLRVSAWRTSSFSRTPANPFAASSATGVRRPPTGSFPTASAKMAPPSCASRPPISGCCSMRASPPCTWA